MPSARPSLLGLLLLVALACAAEPPSPATGSDAGVPVGAGDLDGDLVGSADDCDDRDPSVWQVRMLYRDLDGDGHGAGTSVPVCTGYYLPAGYSLLGDDCDDANPAAYKTRPLFADLDGDGFGAGDPVEVCASEMATPPGYAAVGGDCAPRDRLRWRLLPYAFRDADGDGLPVPEAGTVCAGLDLPQGYATFQGPAGVDCDDANPLVFWSQTGYLDADHDGVGSGPPLALCTDGTLPAGYAATGSDCAPDDPTRWQELPYLHVDRDGDGFTVPSAGVVCAGPWLPAGYSVVPNGQDCDDADSHLWAWRAGYLDADHDGVGAGPAVQVCSAAALPADYAAQAGDCAPDDPSRWRSYAFAFRDLDGDGYTVPESGTLCFGDAPPAGYLTSAGRGPDCDDGDPAIHATVVAYLDADGDEVGAGPAESFCTDGSVPAGYALRGGDCAPDDKQRWQLLSYAYVDRDADGFTAAESGQVCAGGTLPDPYRAVANGKDCDDADPRLHRWVVLYRDLDGDGVGAGPREVQCLADEIPAGWSIRGYDVDDADPVVQDGPGGLMVGLF
ncbi:hypothetical protein [Anaeromyxobacter diazotrophicus]|uniref:Uncharacterized protein n=1 Tax=Anaeromyxobacter diazotrophicus TaxID=2590199 RepID=A0A7I9VMB4_9BACT|nr:hypothetical protein [Anaeromyxobacter diazotrophicus]GEJ57546.1 hypothetical protein AMYX_22870 [Anaeromyxobacter diazotrophicus]